MKNKHMNLLFPQWQGAGKTKELLKGANEIKKRYLSDYKLVEVPVGDNDIDEVKNNILGYDIILQQLQNANQIVMKEEPDSIFTLGGGCDVELIPVSYLNNKLKGDLTLLWIDAHGDLNTPESSPSKLFHGMPLRSLLGDGDAELIKTTFSKLTTSQILLLGQRDLDEPEKDFINEHKIDFLSVEELNSSVNNVVKAVKSKLSNNLYIHVDLDVLDIDEFPYVMVPAPGGLKPQVLLELLIQLKDNFNIAGLSLLEYASSDERELKIISEIIKMGVDL